MKTKSILLAFLLTIQCAAAQERPPKSDASKAVAGGGTPVPFTTATVAEINERKNVVLKLADGTTRRFRLAAQPAYFDSKGVLIEGNSINRGSRVLAHFMDENGEALVDRLLLQP
jgi:hypothetical protein